MWISYKSSSKIKFSILNILTSVFDNMSCCVDVNEETWNNWKQVWEFNEKIKIASVIKKKIPIWADSSRTCHFRASYNFLWRIFLQVLMETTGTLAYLVALFLLL